MREELTEEVTVEQGRKGGMRKPQRYVGEEHPRQKKQQLQGPWSRSVPRASESRQGDHDG